MTFEERMDELAKGQLDLQIGFKELQQSEMRFSNALSHLAEVQADFEAKFAVARARTDMLLGQALEAIARLANTAHAQNETIAEHDTRIERLEDR